MVFHKIAMSSSAAARHFLLVAAALPAVASLKYNHASCSSPFGEIMHQGPCGTAYDEWFECTKCKTIIKNETGKDADPMVRDPVIEKCKPVFKNLVDCLRSDEHVAYINSDREEGATGTGIEYLKSSLQQMIAKVQAEKEKK
jgi:hypothetical protein